MRWIWRTVTTAVLGGLLLSFTPTVAAQKTGAKPMPAPQTSAPVATPQQRVVIVEPVRVFDPFYAYPYPYAYAPDYMNSNFGYVKIDSKLKDAAVYVDGGFADKLEKAKKFALRPGNHQIEVRDSDNRPIFHEKIAVLVGKTTHLKVG
jgi:hypothetical protein